MVAERHPTPGLPPFTFESSEWPSFIHLDLFDEEWSALGLGDEDLR